MSFRPHMGTVADTSRDAASVEATACVRCGRVGNTDMFAKSVVLVFLFACHTSPPSVSSGSGTGEAAAAEHPGAGSATMPPQNDAPVQPARPPTPVPPSAPPTSAPAARPPPAPAPAARPPSTPTPSHGAAARARPGIGEDCGAGDVCAAGLSCVKYYGIAGMQGPEFKSCEVRCEDDHACPKGRTCVTVSDGPGRVCR